MGISIDDLKKIKEEFQKIYMFNPPYNIYVGGCGISSLSALANLKKEIFSSIDKSSLDDLCLHVLLKTPPPERLEFPLQYQEVKVVYEIVGEVKSLLKHSG